METVSDIPIPQHILTEMEENKRVIDEWDKQKQATERYRVLKRNIETCLEARPVATENIKDQQAVEWFSGLKEDVEKKLEKTNERFTALLTAEEQRRKLFLEESDARILKYKQQQDAQTSGFQQKLLFITNRLQSAVERTKQSSKKSKEEVRCRKEMEDLIRSFHSALPHLDLERVFPGYKTVLGENPIYTPSEKKQGDISQKTVDTPPPSLPPKETGKTVKQETETVTEEAKQFSTDVVEMPTPDGKPEVYKYGKRVPKSGTLQEAINKQNGLSFQPVEQPPEQQENKPKIIKITKRKPAEPTE